MKTLILLFSVLFTTMSFAQVPSYVPANGLVGWWPFNGNANDESGTGNNGTVNGATLTTDRNGVANQAYSFDGDDRIDVGNLNLGQIQYSYTYSTWFRTSLNSNTDKTIISDYNSSSEDDNIFSCWNFLEFNNQVVRFETRNYPNGYGVGSTSPLNNGVWHNMVSVLDRNTGQLELYVDGIFISSTSFPNQTNFDANGFLRFGVHMWSNTFQSSAHWIGEIDDIGIWNRALTDCEIQNLYTSTNPTNLTSQTACDSYSWNGTSYSESGFYTGTTTNCVTEFLNLTITPSSTNTTTATACDSYLWNGTTYTASGVYTGNQVGGISAGLTFLPDGAGQQYETSIEISGFDQTTLITSAANFDQLCLDIEHSYIGDLEITLTCPNGTTVSIMNAYNQIPFGWTALVPGGCGNGIGTFLGNDTNIDGGAPGSPVWSYCFSPTNATLGTICAENTAGNTIPNDYTAGGINLPNGTTGNNIAMDTNGVYLPDGNFNDFIGCPVNGNWTLTVQDNQGIDDGYIFQWGLVFGLLPANCITESLNLTINPSTSSSISQTALDSYTWPVNNQTYTTTGAYTAVIPNASGCDSTITLNLTMSFTEINELSVSKLSIYPNPTNGDFTITGLELVGSVSSLTLTDMNGKVVKVLDTKATKFSMASIKPGVYFLNIISGNKQEVLKIVKE